MVKDTRKPVTKKPRSPRKTGVGDFADVRILRPRFKPKTRTVQEIRKAVREYYKSQRLARA